MKNCCNTKTNCNNIIIDKDCNIIINDYDYNYNFVQVFILKLTTSKGSTPTQTIIRDSRNKKVVFNSKGDGFYTICKLTVPLDESKPYYYKNGKFYNNIREVSIQELININPEVSGVKVSYSYYFSTCNLKKCFVKICQEIFNSQTSICNKSNVDSSLLYKRDLIWSALNVINYMAEMDQMEEAQRLLEEITQCNGLCSSYGIKKSSRGCGCGGK